MKPETIKFLEESMEENFCDLGLGKDFLAISQSAQSIKLKKLIKLDLIEIKNFCSLKENEKPSLTVRKYFQTTYMITNLNPEYKKSFYNSGI